VLDQPCLTITGVAAGTVDEGSTGTIDDRPGGSAAAQNPDRLYVLGSTATESQAVFEVPLDGASPARRISIGAQVPVAAVDVSTAVPITAATDSGPVPGLFFAPTNARVPAPAPGSPGPSGVRPPLVVFCHGGPTSAAEVGFDPVVQFFTSRGLAVAVVDYRGSSGYGRSYRRRLEGLWGESDVDDCVNYAVGLAESGLVDGDRMAIRGTSAGGLTALAALIRSRRFAGAATWYGVTDLEALAADTHDFESRYVDSLVGPWPEAAEAYRARSPLHHPDQVRGAVLLLQGQDDPVVPASQAQRFAERLLECDVPCTLTVFQGESHGFRRADTIEASLQAELDFYRSLFAGVAAPGDPGDRRAR
jgi:dipeptidyl aminopeptidase/acylaminoacyl peptidase